MRLIIDTALGSPNRCLKVLDQLNNSNKAINDLNWVRLKNWRESLAMIFDPPSRRPILDHITDIDIDIAGDHIIQALFLISWISDKLGWSFLRVERDTESTKIEFERINGEIISASINPLSVIESESPLITTKSPHIGCAGVSLNGQKADTKVLTSEF